MQGQSGDLQGIASELQGNGIAGLGDDLLRQGIERKEMQQNCTARNSKGTALTSKARVLLWTAGTAGALHNVEKALFSDPWQWRGVERYATALHRYAMARLRNEPNSRASLRRGVAEQRKCTTATCEGNGRIRKSRHSKGKAMFRYAEARHSTDLTGNGKATPRFAMA